jgi:hypothetical protein
MREPVRHLPFLKVVSVATAYATDNLKEKWRSEERHLLDWSDLDQENSKSVRSRVVTPFTVILA